MKSRGLLFSRPMVQKLITRQKTQTRRPIRAQDHYHGCMTGDCPHSDWHDCGAALAALCPYGKSGDRIYAKEVVIPAHRAPEGSTLYAADYPEAELPELSKRYGGWKPSIFMTQREARLWYLLSELRVEPLNRITHADALAEGVSSVEEYARLWDTINSEPFPVYELGSRTKISHYELNPFAGTDRNEKYRKHDLLIRHNPYVYVLTLEPLQ